MKIYGKKFNDIKYELFKQGNSDKRAKFMEELQKIRKDSKYYEHVKEKQHSSSSDFNQSRESIKQFNSNGKFADDFGSGMLKILLPAFGILAVLAYYYETKKQEKFEVDKIQKNKSKHTLGEDKVKAI